MNAAVAMSPAPALEFHPLLERDLPTVATIEADVYVFPWSIGNFRDSLGSGYNCTGCWAGGELIGYAIVMFALEEAHLLNLAVAGKWHGHGVGTRFMRHLIEEARRHRIDVMYLEVRPSNVPGRRMYERFGFRQLGLRRDYYPAVTGREDALFLGLNLTEP